MTYFKEKVTVLGLMLSSFKEWWGVLKQVYPCIIALLVYEALLTYITSVFSDFWVRLITMCLGCFVYLILFSWLFLSVHLVLVEKNFSWTSWWSRIRSRLSPSVLSLLIYLVVPLLVMCLLGVFFKTHFMVSAVHGFFQKPMIAVLLVGGVFTIILYLCFMWLPYTVINNDSLYASAVRSVSVCSGDFWRQAGLLFAFFVAMAILMSAQVSWLALIRSIHLKWLYNAVIYSSLGVWLVIWGVLLMDNSRFDTQDLFRS